MRRRLSDLTIKDAFMFAAVMSDEKQCRRFLEIALEMKILEVHPIAEKSFSFNPDYRGIRLDVLAEEQGTKRKFDVEMQVRPEVALSKRTRYYHSQLDLDALVTGAGYENLPDTYVIFICDFDPFGDQMYRYTIRRRCDENDKCISDGQMTIYLSSKGTNYSEVPEELVKFLKYVRRPENSSGEGESFTDDVRRQVEAIKRDRSWEAKFMLLEEMMRDERAEGRREGRQEGQNMERTRMNRLVQLLSEHNRLEDIVKAASDSEYQEALFKEFNL